MCNTIDTDIKNARIPFREVDKFMNDMESGLVNSDNQEFYRDLDKADNFDELFEDFCKS